MNEWVLVEDDDGKAIAITNDADIKFWITVDHIDILISEDRALRELCDKLNGMALPEPPEQDK